MREKKAVLAINKIVIAVLVIFVVILVIWFWFGLDIPGKLNILIPGFNNSQGGGDINSLEKQIYLDDGNGRCKPIEGIYSLNKEGKLEVFSGSKWINVDEKVATEEQIYNKDIKKGLLNFVDNLEIKQGDTNYKINLVGEGFETKIDGVTYLYQPPNKLFIRNSLDLKLLIESDKTQLNTLQEMGDFNLKLLIDFKNVLLNKNADFFDYTLPVYYDIAVNKVSISTTSGNMNDQIKKLIVYVDFGSSSSSKIYGTDYSKKLLYNQRLKSPSLISDWKDIDGEISSDTEIQLKILKDELIDKCKK